MFVGASIREVVIALSISLVLVVAVILFFLRSWRATLVPLVAIPVSLIGCFILISLWGFSLNTLTLLALLLAIGLVVDDAIVVLENIQRRIEMGEAPVAASYRGARQVTFAVIATSLTLMAVFVPLSFMPGQVGRLFVEFGWVMAGTVAISTFVALTACPALASKILKKRPVSMVSAPETLSLAQRWYQALLQRAVAVPLVVLVVALLDLQAATEPMAQPTLVAVLAVAVVVEVLVAIALLAKLLEKSQEEIHLLNPHYKLCKDKYIE